MEGRLKKRKIVFNNTPDQLHKLVFAIVFPWLYPGLYKTKEQAFRTIMALLGTCRQLRYFQCMRRSAAQLAPSRLHEKLHSHGFPAHFSSQFWMDLIRLKPYVSSAFYFYPMDLQRKPINFQVATFENLAKRTCGTSSSLIFYAPSFAEAVLFIYAVGAIEMAELNKFGLIEVILEVKPGKYEEIVFSVRNKNMFVSRNAIGALKRMGAMAERDFEFVQGTIPTTAYSFFCSVCETSGRKDRKKPLERLRDFVQGWFPLTAHSVGEQDKARRAYEFEMSFEK